MNERKKDPVKSYLDGDIEEARKYLLRNKRVREIFEIYSHPPRGARQRHK